MLLESSVPVSTYAAMKSGLKVQRVDFYPLSYCLSQPMPR